MVLLLFSDSVIQASADEGCFLIKSTTRKCHASIFCVLKPDEIGSSTCHHSDDLNNINVTSENDFGTISVCLGSKANTEHGKHFILTELCDVVSQVDGMLKLQVQVIFSTRGTYDFVLGIHMHVQ